MRIYRGALGHISFRVYASDPCGVLVIEIRAFWVYFGVSLFVRPVCPISSE